MTNSSKPVDTLAHNCDFVLIVLATIPATCTLQAKAAMFPSHDESLKELFEQVCEAGVDRVYELFEKLQRE